MVIIFPKVFKAFGYFFSNQQNLFNKFYLFYKYLLITLFQKFSFLKVKQTILNSAPYLRLIDIQQGYARRPDQIRPKYRLDAQRTDGKEPGSQISDQS